MTPEFAYFSDTIRNLLAGSNGSSLGYVSGQTGKENEIRDNFMARPSWSDNPAQIVQYASCHDNYTLVDKLILSTGKSKIDSDIIQMNNLAATIYMTAQGIPFIHAGEEFLREKLEEDGGRCENSYNASDYVNHLEWSDLENETYAANSDYYKGLIEFRKTHKALRMTDTDAITENIQYVKVNDNVVMFTIDAKAAGDISDQIVVIFNATNKSQSVSLPDGEWNICIDYDQAGIAPQGDAVTGMVDVAGISALVLVQGDTGEEEPPVELTGSIRLASASLNMLSSIRIIYKCVDDVIPTDNANVAERGVLLFANAEDAVTGDPSKAKETVLLSWSEKDQKYIGQSTGFNANAMDESHFAVAYLKLVDGTMIYGTKEGVVQDPIEYSPLIYCRRMVDKGSEESELCRAMMQYGAAAQVAQLEMTSGLMNEGFDPVAFDADVLGESVFSVDKTPTGGFALKSASLDLRAAISYIVKWTVDDTIADKELYAEYTLKGVTQSVKMTYHEGDNGRYRAVISGIPAKDMDETLRVKAYYLDDNGEKVYGAELVYSGYEYARRMIESDSSDDATKDLACALATYIHYADLYSRK